MVKHFTFNHLGRRYLVDGDIYIAQVTGKPDHLVLSKDFHCMGDIIPAGFVWNGASSPALPFLRFIAPKFHKNIIASCWHDYKCGKATTRIQRNHADRGYYLLKKYVEQDDSWKCKLSYVGVQIGAFLGIGSSYKD